MKLFHTQQGMDWRIDALNRKYNGPSVIDLAKDCPVEVIEFDKICRTDFFYPVYTTRECCSCCNGESYYYADITKPGIVLKTNRNPLPLPYRLLDGTHRLWAMQAKGWDRGPFRVMTVEQIKPYLKISYAVL